MANSRARTQTEANHHETGPEGTLTGDEQIPGLPIDVTGQDSDLERLPDAFPQMPEFPPGPAQNMQPPTQFSTGTIDVSALVKAQAYFVAAQTNYLATAALPPGDPALRALQAYSLAQSQYIEALSSVLRQMQVF
jgi:hypothetical protein